MNRTLTWTGLLASVALTVTALSSPDAERCIEISADGREVVELCPEEQPEAFATITGTGVPYGTVPDWSNTLRRQVASVLVADIDGDNDNDVIVGCFNSSSSPPYDDWHHMVYRNTGTALEASPSWISATQYHTNDVQAADFNGDDIIDLFFAANGLSASVASRIYFGLPGNAGPDVNHGWQSVTGAWATSALAFDFDHDGDVDVLTTNQGVSPNPFRPMYLFRNLGTGLETTPSWQSSESSIQSGLDVADIDDDGWEDVAVAKWTNGFQNSIYYNITGTLQTTPSWTSGISGTYKGAGFADVNGDGLIDVAFGGNSAASAPTRLYTHNLDDTFTNTWSATTTFQGTQELRWKDVNNDGWPDLTVVHFSNGRAEIHMNNNGVLDSNPTWFYDAPIVANAVNYGDINGDGCPDLVIGYSGEPSVVVFFHKGNCQPVCIGDLAGGKSGGGDGNVSTPDLLFIINAWGPCPLPPDCPADLDGPGGTPDGTVGVPDLLKIINGWGPCE